MSIDQDDDNEANHSMPDPFVLAISLCQIAANAKTIEPALKRLRRLGRDIAKAEQKLAALTTEAEQKQAAVAQREAELAAREAEIERRETEFTASIDEARDHLREYHDHIAEADRRIRYRILRHADLLVGFNERLQNLPTWQQIKQLVPGLPDDPPPLDERDVAAHPRIDALSDTFSDPNADRHGLQFLGSLTRDVSHRARHE